MKQQDREGEDYSLVGHTGKKQSKNAPQHPTHNTTCNNLPPTNFYKRNTLSGENNKTKQKLLKLDVLWRFVCAYFFVVYYENISLIDLQD